jgi:hypothetical protein
VTGASEGIGRAAAREVAGRGVGVVLVARRETLLQELAEELARDHSVETRVVAVDLADQAGVQAVLEATAELEVGLLVASAGFGTSGPFLQGSLARERSMLAVNCGAVLALTHAYGRAMAERGRGGLVLLSSIVAFQGVPRAAHYAATKAWVQTLAEGLYLELAPLGVDVLAAAPGPVRSGFAVRADMRMGRAMDPGTVAAGAVAALGRRGTVRPGLLSKLLEAALTLPRGLRARVMALVMGSMTAHQPHRAVCEAVQPLGG